MKWSKLLENFNDYDHMFIDYGLALNQVQLLSSLSELVFNDFPMNMPPNVVLPVISKQHKIVTEEMERRGLTSHHKSDDEIKEDEMMRDLANIEFDNKMQRLFILFQNVYSLSRHYKLMPYFIFPDFQRLRLSQEIVMVYSLTEGFISDSVRFVCKLKPEIMKSNKHISWKDVLSHRNFEGLIEDLIEKFVYVICYGNLKKKIDNIDDSLTLSLSLTMDEIRKLEEIDIIRNAIVHNNGKITQKYIEFFDNEKLKIGDDISFDDGYIEELLDNLTDLSYKIYIKISKKFLKTDDRYLIPKPRKLNECKNGFSNASRAQA